MNFLFTSYVMVAMVTMISSKDTSLYYNFYDEVALSTCATSASGKGYYFPVRRLCEKDKKTETCEKVCKKSSVLNDLWNPSTRVECIESLHIFKKRPRLAPNPKKFSKVDLNRVGLILHRYNSCNVSSCGPNYCCCKQLTT